MRLLFVEVNSLVGSRKESKGQGRWTARRLGRSCKRKSTFLSAARGPQEHSESLLRPRKRSTAGKLESTVSKLTVRREMWRPGIR